MLKERLLLVILVACLYSITTADDNDCKILRKVFIEPVNTDLTPKDIGEHEVGEDWEDSSSTTWTCVDSRYTKPTLGTVGGDSGEFILALAVYDKLTNQALSSMMQDQLDTLVRDWLAAFLNSTGSARKMFLHVNQSTVTALRNYMNNASLNIDCVPMELWSRALIPLSENSTFTTCGHLQRMREYSSSYEVSPLIISAYLKAFYSVHWSNCDKRQTWLHISNGSQPEIAILNVYTEKTKLLKDDRCHNKLPLAVPYEENNDEEEIRSAFIEHDAIHYEGIRVQLAQFFASRLQSITPDTFLFEANALGDKQRDLTMNYLAPTLPTFTLKMVMGENDKDSEGDEVGEVAVEILLAAVLMAVVLVGGFFLYRTYKRRKEANFVVLPLDNNNNNNSSSNTDLDHRVTELVN